VATRGFANPGFIFPYGVNVQFDCFTTDTIKMHHHGWQLSVEKSMGHIDQNRRFIFKHEKMKLVLYGRQSRRSFYEFNSRHFAHRTSQEDDEPIMIEGVTSGDKIIVHGRENYQEMTLNPHDYFEANQSIHEGQELKVSHMYETTGLHDIFLPINPTAEDIIIVKADIPGLLSRIREAQVPDQMEILKKNRRTMNVTANIVALAA